MSEERSAECLLEVRDWAHQAFIWLSGVRGSDLKPASNMERLGFLLALPPPGEFLMLDPYSLAVLPAQG